MKNLPRIIFIKGGVNDQFCILFLLILFFTSCQFVDKPDNQGAAVNRVTLFKTGGYVGERMAVNERTWLQPLLDNNPDMFGAFLAPETNSLFKCMWHGEFPGKILTGLAQTYLASHDPHTRSVGDRVVELLGESQWEDGYLGPWSASQRFDNPPEKWDTWGHYHCMYGLYQWYKITGSEQALTIALKAADCIYDYFIKGGRTLASQRWGECNFAVSHIMALLYQQSGEPRYLETAKHIVHSEWKNEYADFYTGTVLSCDWMDAALRGVTFCNSNQKRWESLYSLTTLANLYQITGDQSYYDAMESLWWGIVEHDRHNTGSFGTAEGADGDIYGRGSETCNTVAWMTFSTEYLKLCKESYVADELELSYYNATLGSQLGDKEFVYMNFSDGSRVSSQTDLAPHSYEGGREMNCCQASGNRGLSQFTQWGVLTDSECLYINYYGDAEIMTATPGGNPVKVVQESDYPQTGKVRIRLFPGKSEKFTLALRIPIWAPESVVKINGQVCKGVEPGKYYKVERKWKADDVVELDVDMMVHYWVGDGKMSGRSSVYYGPILLSLREPANQAAEHTFTPESFSGISLKGHEGRWLCTEVKTAGGQTILLEDYATKPAHTDYTTWLDIRTGLCPFQFSRTGRPVWVNVPN